MLEPTKPLGFWPFGGLYNRWQEEDLEFHQWSEKRCQRFLYETVSSKHFLDSNSGVFIPADSHVDDIVCLLRAIVENDDENACVAVATKVGLAAEYGRLDDGYISVWTTWDAISTSFGNLIAPPSQTS